MFTLVSKHCSFQPRQAVSSLEISGIADVNIFRLSSYLQILSCILWLSYNQLDFSDCLWLGMWVLSNSIPAVKIVKTWHLQPSTQTLSSQIAVRLSGKVASSSKQSESEEQPHLCDSSPLPSLSSSWSEPLPSREEPLESEAPAPHIGRSIGQLASEWQPVCTKMGIWHDMTWHFLLLFKQLRPVLQSGPLHQWQLEWSMSHTWRGGHVFWRMF